jgi:hypothetical protein
MIRQFQIIAGLIFVQLLAIGQLTHADTHPEFMFGMSVSEAKQVEFNPAESEPFIPHSSFQPDCQPKCLYYKTEYLGSPALGYVEFFDNTLFLHTYDLYPQESIMKMFTRLGTYISEHIGQPQVHSQNAQDLTAIAIWEITNTKRMIVLSVVVHHEQQRLLLSYIDYSPDELHSATLRFGTDK